jgi:hypothetical protein
LGNSGNAAKCSQVQELLSLVSTILLLSRILFLSSVQVGRATTASRTKRRLNGPSHRPNLPILRCHLFVVNCDSTGRNAVSFCIPFQEMGSHCLSRDQPRLPPIFVIVGVRTDKGLSSMRLAYQDITASQKPPESY